MRTVVSGLTVAGQTGQGAARAHRFFYGASISVIRLASRLGSVQSVLGLAGNQPDLGQFKATQNIQHLHHLLVLHRGVAAQDHGEVRIGGFLGAQPVFQFLQGDRVSIEKDLPIVVHRNRLGLGFR